MVHSAVLVIKVCLLSVFMAGGSDTEVSDVHLRRARNKINEADVRTLGCLGKE